MAERTPSPTISIRERSIPLLGAEERLPKWITVSFLLHALIIAGLFVTPLLPSRRDTAPPVYTVDLVGGEKIGKSNFGTELSPPPKQPSRSSEEKSPPPTPETKKEIKVVREEKVEKAKPVEKKIEIPEKSELKEKSVKETIKREPAKETKEESKTETASADSVRERLLQSAVERAKSRTETGQKISKGEVLSAGGGEGEGAAALGPGGRGGPGVVKGMDFVIYQNRIFNTIKENWAWVGQRSNLRVVVQFSIKDNGDISGLKIVQPSGDPSYDESVLRAVKKSSPLPAPPESYRKDFAEVELAFRPRDLGA
jgi:TonB family protein